MDSLVNLNEFFVHHEDVRRGGGDTTPRPAADIAEVEEALCGASLRRGAALSARKVRGAGLDLARPDGAGRLGQEGDTDRHLHAAGPGRSPSSSSGRRAAAQVELDGPPDAVAAVEGASFGI